MNIGFVGIGSMGGMLVRAFLRKQALPAENVWVANRSLPKLHALEAKFPGIRIATNSQLAGNCDVIFLCLRPADSAAGLAEIGSELLPTKLLVTLASLITLESLESRVPCKTAKLIPSITQEIGRGVALLQYGSRITREDRRLLEQLLGSICEPVVIPDTMMRVAADLVSCGPAFFSYFLQSMAESAIKQHPEFSPEVARRLTWSMASATMQVMSETGMSLQELIERVAVPGGNTAIGIDILSQSLPEAWIRIHRTIAEKEQKDRQTLTL